MSWKNLLRSSCFQRFSLRQEQQQTIQKIEKSTSTQAAAKQTPPLSSQISYTRNVLEDEDGDQISYQPRAHWNSLRRLNIRLNSPGISVYEKNQKFRERIKVLQKVYPFFQSYRFDIIDPPLPEDNELFYDINNFKILPYLKRVFFVPGESKDEDFFPKMVIVIYLGMLINWFIIDVVIMKIIFSEDELKGVDPNKKYVITQLKGQELQKELIESQAKNPQIIYEQSLALKGIQHEINKP